MTDAASPSTGENETLSVAPSESRVRSVPPYSSPTTAENNIAMALAEVSTIVTPELLKVAEDMVTYIPKGNWQDLGSEEEIRRENAVDQQRRTQLQVDFTVPRNVLMQHRSRSRAIADSRSNGLLHYVTKEASEDCRDLRGAVNALYEIARNVVEVGVQATSCRDNRNTQTYFARKVHAAVQAEPTLVDASIEHMTDLPRKESPALSQFLSRVLPRTMHCLLQNYEVPIYVDDYAQFREDDAIVGSRDDMTLSEKGNFVHAATKDRTVTSLGWRSSRGKDDCICVASIAPYTLEERIDAQRRCESSVSLVWDLADPMHPRYILESPNEVQVLKFSPAFPHLLAGGAINGQVYLWDLSLADSVAVSRNRAAAANNTGTEKTEGGDDAAGDAAAAGDDGEAARAEPTVDFREAGELPPMPVSVNGVSWEKDGDVLVPRLQPVQYSRVELSHHRPVQDLQWLPDGLECLLDGKQAVSENGSHQFATVSDDGSVCVWDVRPDYLPPDKLRKMKHQTKSSGTEVVWVPLHKYQLTRPDSVGSDDLMGFRFYFDGVVGDHVTPSYAVAVGSTDGIFATCSSVAKNDGRRGSGVVPVFGNTKDTRFVRHVVEEAHAGPVSCVQRHPIIGDVYLTCGDYTFKVWRAGVNTPLYCSPHIDSQVTCAAWSPSRAAIVIIGTSDGKLQVWDLLDRNNEPLLIHHMVQDAITVLDFKPLPSRLSRKKKYTQHLIVGTKLGSFHWYALPSVLSRGSNGERRQLRTMLEREARRVAYYDWRWVERRQEMDRYGANAPKMMITAGGPTAMEVDEVGAGGDKDDAGRSRSGKKGGKGKKGATKHGFSDDEREALFDDDLNDGYGYDQERDNEFLALVEELRQKEEELMRLESIQ